MTKEKYYMKTIDGDKYYTTNKYLYNKRCLFYKWEDIYNYNGAIFFCTCILTILSLLGFDKSLNLNILISVAIFLGISIPLWTFSIIFYCVASHKLKVYEWEKEFKESKEFKTQENRYAKYYKDLRNKILKNKAKNLVEAYDILEDKDMSKEDKIELLKDYIKEDKYEGR